MKAKQTRKAMTREQAVHLLVTRPYQLGHLLGFDKLTALHNRWIADMVQGTEDTTLQSHRGSYKTTCVSLALALLMVLRPTCRILFMRKTDGDIKEVVAQVRKILESEHMACFVRALYGVELTLTTATVGELSTNLSTDIKGTAQLVGMGTNGSVTGKHFDRIFTDDIVNMQDRLSRAERERIKLLYQELRNVVNRGGRIYNTGTPWHPEDAFSLMPPPQRYDCYSTGLIGAEELAALRSQMAPSLFAANYELRHVATDEEIFPPPLTGADPALAEQGILHLDAAYGGGDSTALTVCRRQGDVYYLYGRLWPRHVDDVQEEICQIRHRFRAGRIYCEDNGDKGYLARQLRRRGERVVTYHEGMNKFLKITTYLRSVWRQVVFVEGTDPAYVRQITDYCEEAEHDDAPDSAASAVRVLWNRRQEPSAVPRVRHSSTAVTGEDLMILP